MSLYTTLTVMRLGAFVVGCATFAAASHFQWSYAGWLLVPTVVAGLMCCSLHSDGPDKPKEKRQ